MANLKEVRTRIESVKSTMQITSAMKMVSASKLRKGQIAIQNLRPYELQLRTLLSNLNNALKPDEKNELCLPKEVSNVLVIVLTANKGLCGTFNSALVRRAARHMVALKESGKTVDVYTLGRKANDFFKKSSFPIIENDLEVVEKVSIKEASQIAQKAIHYILDNQYQRIDIIYNKFRNAASQEPIVEQFLPLPLDEMTITKEDKNPSEEFEYIMEPTRKKLMDKLVPDVIETLLYRILLDSYASEHGARMTAMHKATDNATDLIKNLTITYNKVRQASITNEIVEIVGGAEALNA